MKSYYRVMLGRGSSLVEECLNGGFIGAHFGFKQDLTAELTDDKHQFIDRLAPEWMERDPEKTRRSAGQAVGFLWRVMIGINEGDTILSPDGQGAYTVGTVTEPYSYHKDHPLPHRRSVKWTDRKIGRNEMSESLRNALGTPGTVGYVTKHAEEILEKNEADVIFLGRELLRNPYWNLYSQENVAAWPVQYQRSFESFDKIKYVRE